MADKPATPIEVFISYCHVDDIHRQNLLKQLANLRRQGVISAWHDGLITAGTELDEAIKAHLESAQIILLLVSPDWMASTYCWEVELARALERHQARDARVIPIIVRPTDWEGAAFTKLKMLPTDARPVSTWSDPDSAWLDVVKGLRAAIRELRP